MQLYKIINLDCSKKENRKKLLLKTMKIIKAKEKPTKEKLESICKKLGKKYNIELGTIYPVNNKFQLSIRVDDFAFSCFYCISYYEALLKYILYVYYKVKDR